MSLDVHLYMGKCEHCGMGESNVFSANITHNLIHMAEEAGIYKHLWRPEEIGITIARQLIQPLSDGLERMKKNPERFKKFDSPNGWGLYEHFVPWIQEYIDACNEYPKAFIGVSR